MGSLNPMNIFLRQEVYRMQRIVTVERANLTDLKVAIDGTIIMSEVRLLIRLIYFPNTSNNTSVLLFLSPNLKFYTLHWTSVIYTECFYKCDKDYNMTHLQKLRFYHNVSLLLRCEMLCVEPAFNSLTPLAPRTSRIPWTTFLMPVCQTCGGKSPGSHPSWAFGSRNFWRETNSSTTGCLKEVPKTFWMTGLFNPQGTVVCWNRHY